MVTNHIKTSLSVTLVPGLSNNNDAITLHLIILGRIIVSC